VHSPSLYSKAWKADVRQTADWSYIDTEGNTLTLLCALQYCSVWVCVCVQSLVICVPSIHNMPCSINVLFKVMIFPHLSIFTCETEYVSISEDVKIIKLTKGHVSQHAVSALTHLIEQKYMMYASTDLRPVLVDIKTSHSPCRTPGSIITALISLAQAGSKTYYGIWSRSPT